MLILILALCLTKFHKSKSESAYIVGVFIMLEVLFLDMYLVTTIAKNVLA